MKVWWCEEHEHPSDDVEQCYETDWIPCRMVEMQLVPADAELQCPNCKFVYEAESST